MGTGRDIDELSRAAAVGDVALVRTLLSGTINPNVPSSKGVPPIFDAASYGHVDVIRALVASGADVNYRTDAGYTPVMAASWLPRRRTIDVLVRLGADVVAEDGTGRTPLTFACQHGTAETVECLLQHGARLQTRSRPPRATPLMYAVYNDLHGGEIIALLDSWGASCDERDSDGRTAKEHALARAPHLVKLLAT